MTTLLEKMTFGNKTIAAQVAGMFLLWQGVVNVALLFIWSICNYGINHWAAITLSYILLIGWNAYLVSTWFTHSQTIEVTEDDIAKNQVVEKENLKSTYSMFGWFSLLMGLYNLDIAASANKSGTVKIKSLAWDTLESITKGIADSQKEQTQELLSRQARLAGVARSYIDASLSSPVDNVSGLQNLAKLNSMRQ